MELNGAKILYTIHTDIPLLGDLKITQTLVTTWIVMALLSGLAIWLEAGCPDGHDDPHRLQKHSDVVGSL